MTSSVLPGASRGRTVAERALDGWRYLWPVLFETVVPLRHRRRETALRRAESAPPAKTSSPPIVLVCVYRARNERSLRALLRQAGHDAEVRLWALDEVIPDLAHLTVGHGPAPKFELINRLLSAGDVRADAYVVIADDDVVFGRGDLPTTVGVGHRLGLDLFQPSHAWASIFTYPMLLSRPATVARRTRFVEIGPLFVVGPGRRDRFLPFGSEHRMGWGLEVDWHRQAIDGSRLGVIDHCRMLHLEPVGRTYDRTEEIAAHEAALRGVGQRNVYGLMGCLERWPAASEPGR